jgi:hypothetical protein
MHAFCHFKPDKTSSLMEKVQINTTLYISIKSNVLDKRWLEQEANSQQLLIHGIF